MSYFRPYRAAILPAVLTIVSGALLFHWLVPNVVGKAGLPFFDARFHGYTQPIAEDILDSIGSEGIALYLAKWPVYDTIFPLCTGLLMITLLCVATRAYPMPARLLVGLLALSPIVADLFENARVGAMLANYQQSQTAQGVAAASAMSVLKWKCFACVIAMIFLFVAADVQQFARQRGQQFGKQRGPT